MSRARARVETEPLEGGAQVRRDGARVLPAGPKAVRTRNALLVAAAELFSEQGFQGTAVAQIAERAGVSLGTFYQYFRHRGDVLTAMLADNLKRMSRRAETTWRAAGGLAGLEQLIANYVRSYAEAGDTVGIWESVSHTEPEMAELRRSLGRAIKSAIEQELVRAGRRGDCRRMSKREAELSAIALAGMVDRFCFDVFVFDPPAHVPDAEEAGRVLARLWADAIELSERGGA